MKNFSESFTRIALFDTSMGSSNLGDHIIMEAVNSIVAEIFPRAMILRLPSRMPMGIAGKRILRDADLVLVGGTNLLTSHILKYRQWHIDPVDAALMRDAVLVGAGWWQYQGKPDLLTRALLNTALSHKYAQSVRDSYSARQLSHVRSLQVINTSCPTTWQLDNCKLAQACAEPVDVVVTTVTDYLPNPTRDALMLESLRKRYSKVYLWLQGIGDYNYTKQFDLSGIERIDPTLKAYDDVLASPCEYLGTRLHAGIRAMQFGRFAQIVPIDNRAREMAVDCGIPLIEDLSVSGLESHFGAGRSIRVELPQAEIARWKAQFEGFSTHQ